MHGSRPRLVQLTTSLPGATWHLRVPGRAPRLCNIAGRPLSPYPVFLSHPLSSRVLRVHLYARPGPPLHPLFSSLLLGPGRNGGKRSATRIGRPASAVESSRARAPRSRRPAAGSAGGGNARLVSVAPPPHGRRVGSPRRVGSAGGGNARLVPVAPPPQRAGPGEATHGSCPWRRLPSVPAARPLLFWQVGAVPPLNAP